MNRRHLFCGAIGLLLLAGCGSSDTEDKGPGGVASEDWKKFDPESGKFSVLMPGEPKLVAAESNSGSKSWTVAAGGLTYTIRYERLHLDPDHPIVDPDAAEAKVDDELKLYAYSYLPAGSGGRRIGDPKPQSVDGHPGREVIYEFKDKTRRRVWACAVDSRVYWLEVTGPKELVTSGDAGMFLDSLKLGS